MTYLEHIRDMSDADLAYFLNFLQPYIPLLALAMERTLKQKGKRDEWRAGDRCTVRLNGDARQLYLTLLKDFDEEMRKLDDEMNENAT